MEKEGSSAPKAAVSDGHREARSVVPAPRFFAAIAYLVLALCLAEALARGALALRERSRRSPLSSPVYAGQPWASPLWEEWASFLRSAAYRSYEPFVVNGHLLYHSTYLNIDQTRFGPLRRSSSPQCSGEASLVVWTFGGSTTFGVGVPDEMTWPSDLVAQLGSKTHRCVSVFNFGEVEWVSNQQIVRLVQVLKAGGRPDAVVLLNGVEETWNGVIEPGAAETYLGYAYDEQFRERSPWFGLGELRIIQLMHEIWSSGAGHTVRVSGVPRRVGWSDSDVEERARHTVENYAANIKILEALSGHYGFRIFAFWQPTLLYGSSKTSIPFEQEVISDPQEGLSSDQLNRAFRATYSEAERRADADGFVSLVHIFDDAKVPMYVDAYHLGPSGNQALASAIAAVVASDLKDSNR